MPVSDLMSIRRSHSSGDLPSLPTEAIRRKQAGALMGEAKRLQTWTDARLPTLRQELEKHPAVKSIDEQNNIISVTANLSQFGKQLCETVDNLSSLLKQTEKATSDLLLRQPLSRGRRADRQHALMISEDTKAEKRAQSLSRGIAQHRAVSKQLPPNPKGHPLVSRDAFDVMVNRLKVLQEADRLNEEEDLGAEEKQLIRELYTTLDDTAKNNSDLSNLIHSLCDGLAMHQQYQQENAHLLQTCNEEAGNRLPPAE